MEMTRASELGRPELALFFITSLALMEAGDIYETPRAPRFADGKVQESFPKLKLAIRSHNASENPRSDLRFRK